MFSEARMNAAKYNDKLSSREGAAELLGLSVSSVADTELGLHKVMPVDKAVMMAEVYNAPQLLNYYCLNECPIGCRHEISDKDEPIELIVLKMMELLNPDWIRSKQETLIRIAKDGKVDKTEMAAFYDVIHELGLISRFVSELKILADTKGWEVEDDEDA